MASNHQFFLKTAPLPGEESSPYTTLYLRHHGSGFNSVVLTTSPPKFIKAHIDGNRISFTSAAHEGRQWGLTLAGADGQCAGWEKVEIVEDGGSEGFRICQSSEDKEVETLEYDGLHSGEKIWIGWMVCDWAHGHPQLFWVTNQLKAELPSFCHRVQVVREML